MEESNIDLVVCDKNAVRTINDGFQCLQVGAVFLQKSQILPAIFSYLYFVQLAIYPLCGWKVDL